MRRTLSTSCRPRVLIPSSQCSFGAFLAGKEVVRNGEGGGKCVLSVIHCVLDVALLHVEFRSDVLDLTSVPSSSPQLRLQASLHAQFALTHQLGSALLKHRRTCVPVRGGHFVGPTCLGVTCCRAPPAKTNNRPAQSTRSSLRDHALGSGTPLARGPLALSSRTAGTGDSDHRGLHVSEHRVR